MDRYIEHRYLTDDQDERNRTELVIAHAPNGDYYIGSVPEGEGAAGRLVRICTSGGASSRNPRLVKAVYDLFQALGGWEQELSDPPRNKAGDSQ